MNLSLEKKERKNKLFMKKRAEKIRYIDIFEEELEYEFYDLNDTLIK